MAVSITHGEPSALPGIAGRKVALGLRTRGGPGVLAVRARSRRAALAGSD